MKLAGSPSWGYGRRELRAGALARRRAAGERGSKNPSDRLKRSRKWLREDFGLRVGVRP